MNNWYNDNIEEPIRDLVKLLRNNGFNTECSCGHKMYVQCQYILSDEVQRLHNLLYENGYRNYEIDIQVKVINGYSYSSLDVKIKEKRKEREYLNKGPEWLIYG